MKCLILAAGRFGEPARAAIAAGRDPRLDVFELARALDADILDFDAVERSNARTVHLARKRAGNSAATALLGFFERKGYDAFFTTGEDIGLPLSALFAASSARCSHTMIAHTLHPAKKRVFFRFGRVADRIDRMLVYSTSEERLAIDTLGIPAARVDRIHYHADERFFRPDSRPTEPDLICAAGQLLRDYDCLVAAVRGLPARVQIAAGSPWIEHTLRPKADLPENVTWGKLGRFELRELYARAALAVVPIQENPYQTGIATILEMMAMGKCVIATRTRGQTDTIVDGVSGFYVPPGDSAALRRTIQRLLANPEEAARVGKAARKFVEERAGLDLFVNKLAEAIRFGHEARFGTRA
jgi:glycosyltransferase involved in cell wall biosynthesis